MTAPTLLAEDQAFDPLEPTGAAELYRRLEAAEPRRVRRTELQGQVGLSARELYELGCTVEPLAVERLGSAIGWRLAVVVGALIVSVFLATAVSAGLDVLAVTQPEDETDLLVAVIVLLLALAIGGLALMRFGIHRLRGLDAERRRAGTHAARKASNDPHGRAAVAALQGPGVLRVQLLWIRGDALDPSFAEVRTLAERRVEEDDGGRAEDAVASLSEIALRADSAHALRHQSGLRALGLRRRRRRTGDRLTSPAAPPAAEKAEREVGLGWRPEPLTDEGQGELARRLVTAERERWSASVLEPLLVTRAADAPRDAPPWPERRKARPIKNDLVVMRRYWMWGAIVTAGFALAADGDAALRVAIAGVAAVVALAAGLGPRLSPRHWRGAQLTHAVRTAAASPPRALEQGLPGPAGLFAVARGRGRGIALVHVRPAPDDGRRGELEVRTLATLDVADDDLDALGAFCAIAAEAQLRSRGVGRSARSLRALVTRLGHVAGRTGEPGLFDEPLAWVAAGPILALVGLSIKHTLAGTWLEDGIHGRSLGFAALLFTSYLLLHAARRIRDPFAL